MKSRCLMAFAAVLASNLVALAIVACLVAFAKTQPAGPAAYILSTFTLVPVLMGFLLEYVRARAGLVRSEKAWTTALNLIIAYAICTFVLREGVICLVMASPLVLLFHAGGVALAGFIGRWQGGRLSVSVVPLLLVLMAVDLFSPHRFEGSESDTMVVRARPETVWRYIEAYPPNRRPPDYWLWRLGLPAPIESRVTAHEVGAVRECAFTGGVAAQERVTAYEPARRLAFDVTQQPDHPEVVGHFTLQRGEFLLTDNGDGTTTVTGTSWYSLHVFPSQYYDLWVQDIVRRVHLRVMRHVKALAEAEAR